MRLHRQYRETRKASKRAWDERQDLNLLAMIAEIGPHQWELISNQMPGRSGKQCRERWHNQLNPLLKKTSWSTEEDWVLFILHQTLQSRWAKITDFLLGRSDNSIKNYWNSTLVHKHAEMNRELMMLLKNYSGDSNSPLLQEQVLQAILQTQVRRTQSQYLVYLRKKLGQL